MKKFMRALVLCCVLAAALSVTAWATDTQIVQNGTCGNDLTWTLDSEGTLRISGTGDMEEYFHRNMYNSNAPWFDSRERIKSVVIEPGVTLISSYAFSFCGSFTEVSIPNTVDTIENSAFERCTSLKTVTIPDSVVHMYEDAFKECSNLTSVKLSKNLEYIPNSAFQECTSLKNISLLGNLSHIGESAFASCYRLQFITLPDSLTTIDKSAFSDCSRLSDIYYTGNRESWNAITIDNSDSANYTIFNAKLHYNFPVDAGLITLDNTTLTVQLGGSVTLTPTFYPENVDEEPLRWSSSDSNIVDVTDGTILAKAPGTAVITAETLDSRIFASCTVTVTAPGTAGAFRINWITVRNEAGKELYTIPKNDFLTTVSITNETSSENPLVFFASYTAQGQFLGKLLYAKVYVSPGATAEFTIPVENDGDIGLIKAFVVPSFDDMAPLAPAVSFPAA